MLSSKRYTRTMARPASPEAADPPRPGSSLSGAISASDLRVKARVTSGSAPKKRLGLVHGAERADPAPSSTSHGMRSVTGPLRAAPETPGASSSSSAYKRPRSNSRAAAAPPMPAASVSRPASRAGGEFSRPASRMDDFPTSSFVSAATFAQQDEHPSDMLAGGMGGLSLKHRIDSDTSIGTTMPAVPKSESVLVCVRVRPPAVSHTVQVVNPAHLEEAWRMDTDEGSVRLGDGSGQEYRFGQWLRLSSSGCTPPALTNS